ncbi:MAG: VTT domain-containing protein [Planctomycetota bacterium]
MPEATAPRASWIKLALLAIVAVGLPAVGLAVVGIVGGDALAEALTLPAWSAPLVATAIGLVCGLALLPTHLTSLASGYLLGLAVGLPTAIVGVIAGAGLGYFLASRLDVAALRSMIQRYRVGRSLTDAMLERGPARATTAVLLARLPPQVPFALGNVLAASLRIPLRPMLLGTALGMAPRVGLVVWLGSELADWDATAAPPMSLYLSLAAALVGLLGLTAWSAAILRHRGSYTP